MCGAISIHPLPVPGANWGYCCYQVLTGDVEEI